MAGDIPGGRCRSFPGRRRILGRVRRRRWRGHIGNDLIKQGSAGGGQLLFAPFAVTVRMLGEARLANNLCHIVLHHAGNRMIQQKAAPWAVIIDQVAEAFSRFGHERLIRVELCVATPEADYNPRGIKNPLAISRHQERGVTGTMEQGLVE